MLWIPVIIMQMKKKINFDIIYHYTSLNPNVIGENRNLNKNIKDVASLNFPDHMPVIMFLASNSCKNLTKWEQLHKDVNNSNPDSEIIILEGSHFIHLDKRKQLLISLRL